MILSQLNKLIARGADGRNDDRQTDTGLRGNARQFVTDLYQMVLLREPDEEGISAHLKALKDGQSPQQVISTFLLSPEYLSRINEPPMFAGYVEQDLGIFEGFKNPLVQPRPGFVTDFVGSRVRLSSLWNGCEPLDNRVLGLPIPFDYHADVLEWLGALKAVAAAKDRFAVMELGAGYAPWLAASAAAASLKGITDMVLCGVEADPGRFAMMQQNLEDNNLMSHEVVLVQAAVGISDGMVRWPRLHDPRNNAGARPLREGNAEDTIYLGQMVQLDEMINIEVVSFGRMLERCPRWDLVHIDVQGTEVELCRAFLGPLSQRVRYVVVGTHSRKLDGDFMEMMINAGWILEHERPSRLMTRPEASSLIQMTTHDGTQVWRNPTL